MAKNIILITYNYLMRGVIMGNKFIVRPKDADKKEDKTVIMTLRMDRKIQEEFDELSAKSERSRNELMCMALRYALDNLEFISEDE